MFSYCIFLSQDRDGFRSDLEFRSGLGLRFAVENHSDMSDRLPLLIRSKGKLS